ncbi:hypothetical protein Pmani_026970 [Petrolisthes manimaculis]|uniref:Ig-like domain-containing protein n=1 Tax=Petrolisthes manimaculis TaxID=1843537 RepID=A0AAE1TWX9_9EUCA|nr:hypothetical protein Pmani_026970 [Petrolisthes manimaculis]
MKGREGSDREMCEVEREYMVVTDGLRVRESDIPPYKLRGETAELRCDYELESSSIYSVKWFKDDEEFYRYLPKDTPPTHYYRMTGVTVDKQSTVPARVVLHKVGFNSSGQYRCEVSAEAPDFNTVNCRGSLMVVEPPADGPVITGGRTKYHVNDTVDLVCTSSPSRPPSRLSWLINGRQARPEFVTKERPYMGKDGLMTQISRLVFVTRPSHFHGGKLKIKCVADITGETLAKHSAFSHTFKPWERLFLASAGGQVLTPPASLLLFLFLASTLGLTRLR